MRDVFRIGMLLIFLFIAGVFDFQSRRIPNWWIITGFLTGYIFRCEMQGGIIQQELLPDLLIPLSALYLLWKIGGIGAGDMKVVCIISLFENWRKAFEIFYLGMVFAAIYGGIKLVRRKILKRKLSEVVRYMIQSLQNRKTLTCKTETVSMLPLCVFIFWATACEKIAGRL